MTKPKIFFSYAWERKEDIIYELYKNLSTDKDFEVIIDKVDLGYRGLISDFAKEIGKASYVIIVLSDKYVKSYNCMFELYEIFRNSNLEAKKLLTKIFPVRIEAIDLGPTNSYSKHWENLLKDIPLDDLRYHNYKDINNFLDRLIPFLADINSSISIADVLDENSFARIKAAIKDRFHGTKENFKDAPEIKYACDRKRQDSFFIERIQFKSNMHFFALTGHQRNRHDFYIERVNIFLRNKEKLNTQRNIVALKSFPSKEYVSNQLLREVVFSFNKGVDSRTPEDHLLNSLASLQYDLIIGVKIEDVIIKGSGNARKLKEGIEDFITKISLIELPKTIHIFFLLEESDPNMLTHNLFLWLNEIRWRRLFNNKRIGLMPRLKNIRKQDIEGWTREDLGINFEEARDEIRSIDRISWWGITMEKAELIMKQVIDHKEKTSHK